MILQSLSIITVLFSACATTVAGENGTASQLAGFLQQEQALTRAIEESPQSVNLLSRRGDMRQFLGRFAAAVADYEKMIELDPAQDAPHWRLGIAYYFNGEFEKGSKQFEKYHLHDGRDRENGVWKFLCDARSRGLDQARSSMLVYTRFDRHPFPSIYEMLEGKMSPQAVLDAARDLGGKQNPQVAFFAMYYAGVYYDLIGDAAKGGRLVTEAVNLFTEETAGNGGPGYMWQVARLHAGAIEKELSDTAGISHTGSALKTLSKFSKGTETDRERSTALRPSLAHPRPTLRSIASEEPYTGHALWSPKDMLLHSPTGLVSIGIAVTNSSLLTVSILPENP